MGGSLPFIGKPSGSNQIVVGVDDSTTGRDPLAIVVDSVAVDSAQVEDTTGVEADSVAVEDTATVVVDLPPPDGSLAVILSPRTASITIDGRSVSGLDHMLPPGPHRVAASAPGYVSVTRSVDIISGQPARLRIALVEDAPPPPVSQCTDFDPDSYNLNGECFDSRARPRETTLVPLTEEIIEVPSIAVLAIKVRADGTAETVIPVTPSDNTAFTILAINFALALDYQPAQKDGRAVTAWTQQVFHPKAR